MCNTDDIHGALNVCILDKYYCTYIANMHEKKHGLQLIENAWRLSNLDKLSDKF